MPAIGELRITSALPRVEGTVTVRVGGLDPRSSGGAEGLQQRISSRVRVLVCQGLSKLVPWVFLRGLLLGSLLLQRAIVSGVRGPVGHSHGAHTGGSCPREARCVSGESCGAVRRDVPPSPSSRPREGLGAQEPMHIGDVAWDPRAARAHRQRCCRLVTGGLRRARLPAAEQVRRRRASDCWANAGSCFRC